MIRRTRSFLRTVWNTKGLARYMFWAGVLITAVYVVFAIFAPWIAPYGFAQTSAHGVDFPKLGPYDSRHLLGTNDQFFDIESRMIWGARTALEVVVMSVIRMRPPWPGYRPGAGELKPGLRKSPTPRPPPHRDGEGAGGVGLFPGTSG